MYFFEWVVTTQLDENVNKNLEKQTRSGKLWCAIIQFLTELIIDQN